MKPRGNPLASLAVTHPELAAQWHPTKNGNLTPADVVAGTHKKIWWKCPNGPDHEWEANGNNRTNGTSCPYCAGKKASASNSLENYPELAAQFHPTKNGSLTPADVVAGTAKKMWWKCPEGLDHEWKAVVVSRLNGRGCPSCSILGFSPSQPGWIYLVSHDEWRLLQIGISNNPEVRLNKHSKSGWALLDLRGPMDGSLAYQWEQDILQAMMKTGIPVRSDKDTGRFDGYTEAWPKSDLSVLKIRELMDLVEQLEDDDA